MPDFGSLNPSLECAVDSNRFAEIGVQYRGSEFFGASDRTWTSLVAACIDEHGEGCPTQRKGSC